MEKTKQNGNFQESWPRDTDVLTTVNPFFFVTQFAFFFFAVLFLLPTGGIFGAGPA
jgi:hypothetical protein